MHIYFVLSRAYTEILREEQVPLLINYVYMRKLKDTSLLAPIEVPGGFPEIIVDSGGYQIQVNVRAVRDAKVGAYGFWLQNEVIPKHPEVKMYMNLDIATVGVSKKPIKEKIDMYKRSAEQTFENQQILEEKFGLHPLPVWHAGEPEDYLRDYCERYDYVAIGGVASSGSPTRNEMLKLLSFVMQKYPKTKFHLFGVGLSGLTAFRTHAPYSTDFSTWNVPARYGHNLIEDDKMLLKEIVLPLKDRMAIKEDLDLTHKYLRETIRKIKMLEIKLNKPGTTEMTKQGLLL